MIASESYKMGLSGLLEAPQTCRHEKIERAQPRECSDVRTYPRACPERSRRGRWPRFASGLCELTWVSPYSEGDNPRCHSYRSSRAIGPTEFAHLYVRWPRFASGLCELTWVFAIFRRRQPQM